MVNLTVRKRGLTALRGCGRQHAAASDLLPPQANLLLELLDLTVAVSLLLTLLLMPQVVLHQLNGSNEGLGNAEMGVLLQNAEKDGSEQSGSAFKLCWGELWLTFSRSAQLPKSCSDR